MIAPLAQQLSNIGFSHFAIGIANQNAGPSLALVYHPRSCEQFAARQAFLTAEIDLQITLNSDVRDDDDDGHFHEVRSRAFDKGWGKFREVSGTPTRLFLGVYSDPTLEGNLEAAVEKVWDACTNFSSIRWDVNSFGLASMAAIVSIGLFTNIQTHWATAPGNTRVIYFPFDDRSFYDIARRSLRESFGSEWVYEPDPQLDLFR